MEQERAEEPMDSALDSRDRIIESIHATPCRLVLALGGGGSRALADLLIVPGASRTVLEAVVPYSEGAMLYFLGGTPDQFCSARTARAMAMAGFRRACCYVGSSREVAGVSCTASLASDRIKRGEHRAYCALQNGDVTVTWSLTLEKGRRTREQEERLVGRVVLNAVAEACGISARWGLDLSETERVERSAVAASGPWRDLLLGAVERVHHGSTASPAPDRPLVLFPGAFNPLHSGHCGMARIAEETLSAAVEYEISIVNVDKPPLDYHEMDARTRQFAPEQSVWLTRASTFEEKSRLFPGATFVVGSDTIARVANSGYYGKDADACRLALERIARRGCRFLVFGRYVNGRYTCLTDLDLPEILRSLCSEVPETRFREDISSTEIRRRGEQ